MRRTAVLVLALLLVPALADAQSRVDSTRFVAGGFGGELDLGHAALGGALVGSRVGRHSRQRHDCRSCARGTPARVSVPEKALAQGFKALAPGCVSMSPPLAPQTCPPEQVATLLKLWELRHEERMEHAFEWFYVDFSYRNIDSYKGFREHYPEGTSAHGYLAILRQFYDLAGVLVKHAALDGALFFETFGPAARHWQRLGPIYLDMREEQRNPRLAVHFEELARASTRWEAQNPLS